MRALYLLPLTFVVGIEGFAMFAPYVVLVLAAAYAAARVRVRARGDEPMQLAAVPA